ncbi:MAG: FAD-dependent oxidoreductase [Alphaproteobacteria bacterium]|nr:FAD-dependent oxidoreductase [Alphaproteobacteria bacterium]
MEFPSHAQAVVIGGGVVGCSVLYHLTKAGWRDVVLLERAELTSGSTWHAAGGMHTLNGDPNVAKLQQYTIGLYKEIEEISGQACGVHLTGGVMMAGTPERMDWLKMAHARGRYLGMETEIISSREAAEIMPLLDPDQFVGAMWDPMEGHLDPSGVTHAYAKSARTNGATVIRQTRVEDLVQNADGSWRVITAGGEIHTQHVVNAGGLWAREVGRMTGLELPILAMEHMYLFTDDMAEVVAFNETAGKEVPHCIDFEGELYLRQERRGMLMGTYERAGKPWSAEETPWDFDTELLEPDLDRIAPSLEVGFQHFPAFQNAGIKQIINGPFTFAPDGNPLIGPIRGLPNYWVACGVMAGFSQGGGVGLALSNWMVDGDPGFDVWAMDVARFGDWATMAYTNAKVRENYSRRFRIQFPNEELPAARPLKATAIYDRLKERGAVFGSAWGLEAALWYARSGEDARDVFSFRRSNDFAAVGEECHAVRDGVGVFEISAYANYEVTGPDAADWLDRLLPNRLPKVGRMVLTPMLNAGGMLIGDFTLARAAEDRFYLIGSGVAEQYHMRWFLQHLTTSGVALRAISLDMQGLQIAGPKSRDLLQGLTRRDVSADAFKFMAFDEFDVGTIPARVGRVSFTGGLGYEIWVRPEYLSALFDLLVDAGQGMGLRPFGSRALNSLRLEKNWGTWAREYRPIYTPFEAGLGRFVAMQKEDFIGRAAAIAARDAGPARTLTTLVVEADGADVISDEPIWRNGEVVGWVTSGGYAHWSRRSVAMGYVRRDAIDVDAGYEVEIIGDRRSARIQAEPLFDPAGKVMRG